MFSSAGTCGRVVVIGCPAKMYGRIRVLGLDEYYLRHFRHCLGRLVPRELPETAKIWSKHFFESVKQRKEGNPAVIDAPTNVVGVQPFENEASLDRRNRARLGIIDKRIATARH